MSESSNGNKRSPEEQPQPVPAGPLSIGQADFEKGCLLLVDKPAGWTSFDVVNKIRFRLRKISGKKKIKVGHAGTLDPMATGLLIIATGKFTKLLHHLQLLEKEYSGTFRMGATTPSYDADSDPDATFPTDHIVPGLLEEQRIRFLGEIDQMPPMFSAIKVGGQPLYKLARKGRKVEVQARRVHIYQFEIETDGFPEIAFRVRCSKGTYIRSLAHDFGKACGSGAYLTSLRRESSGTFSIEDAWKLPDLIAALETRIPPERLV